MPTTATPGALSGIKVLDLSRVLAGPWATQMLADLGADVIKVERPVAGDDTRHWGPPFLKDDAGQATREASYFTACNRNKRSITVDMAHPEGQALLRQMAAEADVVVENFKVGGLQQYGLDYDSLKALNPRLIYCSITGFGQDGPYAERAGYDLMVQAMCGLMSITGHADGEPGGGPLKVGVAVIDVFTGLYASNAILAALNARDNARHGTGQGQYIDMALLDVGMAVLANQAAGFLATGQAPGRAGNIHPSLAPYQDFPSRDGNVLLAIGNDGQFARFCEACGHPDWAQDARFATNTARVQHRAELLERLLPVMRTRTTAEWIALLEDKAVPCGPINTVAQAFDDPQVRHRGIARTLPRQAGDGIAQVATVANPMRLSATPVSYRRAPPSLGQHTQEVLHELGLSEERIRALHAARAI
ncbi:CaiB/BaiF CoA transferase family protein [Comamonas aquatica]|jgi:crotonobetainyl-CoA:carnitine CoA-transferase CaiB-like acyl-CoA transferase|uniref:Formyl-coenzyme A transferase n=1 Tax=Comamonas aquatica TaxID=225991 RepID=A0AA35DAV2_9BURK|nr:CaiB/BaiF CoA-transferase family protein [Comamonas aquatica]MDH0900571.1 CoA transferase [Comamonas aquatica]MDH1380309.1 CoA transferase [Comamonas aquatica]MDH1640078.1 CoA transferase [Comamonas aquatica]CAB5653894.1 Formyl-coenzyme A transferase [Comamonas aquatica]CAB5707718.1 Formyl-coenzyme A transferase [Comamonas aquatica]